MTAPADTLREALAPFAAVADLYDDREDDSFRLFADMDLDAIKKLTLGACRKARAALALPEGAGTVRAISADYFDRHPSEAPPAYAALTGNPVKMSAANKEDIIRILNAHFWTGEPGQHDAIKAATEALSTLPPQDRNP